MRLRFPSPIYLSPLYREYDPLIPQRHRSFSIHRNNAIVAQRRRLFSHDWSHYDDDKKSNEKSTEKSNGKSFEKSKSPNALGPLHDDHENDDNKTEEIQSTESPPIKSSESPPDIEDNEWKEDDHDILSCATATLPSEVENVSDFQIIPDFGLWTRDCIFRLTMPPLHEQVDAVNSCYEPCQRVLGGLNMLARWGDPALQLRSKYLIEFLSQQCLFGDTIKSAQVHEALKIAPFPIVVALLQKYPKFDRILLNHYQSKREQSPQFMFNYGRIFGTKVMTHILHFMDHIYKVCWWCISVWEVAVMEDVTLLMS